MVQGRLFAENEVNSRLQLAIVNQNFVKNRLEGQNALGRVIRIPQLKQPPSSLENDSFQVIGVVNDTLNRGLSDQMVPEVYIPFTVTARADRIVVLTNGDPASMTHSVVSQVYAIDKDQPVTGMRTMGTALEESIYSGPRFNLALFSAFAALGLILAVIGVYGVMSNSVAQQTQEIGVRMALGAAPGIITRMVVWRGVVLLLVGIVIGLVGSFFSVRLLSSQVQIVSPFDAISFSAVPLVLLAAGVLACLWPAMRAARVDPVLALRGE